MESPDVNVLVYAFDRGGHRHQEYADWLEQLVFSGNPFGISELALCGFVRIVTNPKIFKKPASLEDALAFTDAILASANAVRLAPGAKHWEIFGNLCRKTRARGNLISDAYFAAIAIENACVWVTTDRDYAKFPGLRWMHPLKNSAS